MWKRVILLAAATVVLGGQDSTDSFQKHTIRAEGIEASYISFGATLTSLLVPGRDGTPVDIIVGYDEGSQYLNNSQNEHTYFGATVGRYAGRIKNSTFTIDDTEYNVTPNEEGGPSTLHGGAVGYDQRNWTLVAANESTVTFSLFDDNFEGFPGRVVIYATFTVGAGPSLTSRLVSIPLDETTPIMVITHPYFNLDGFTNPSDPSVLEHTLHLPFSTRYTVSDTILVATGQLQSVEGPSIDYSNASSPTLMDFTTPRTFGSSIDAGIQQCGFNCTGIDSNFLIDRPPTSSPFSSAFPVLTLSSNYTGINLDLYTNQQALIVYTCNGIPANTIPLKSGQQSGGGPAYVPVQGCVALETQGWVDAINHPEWAQQPYQVFGPETGAVESWTRYVFNIVN